MSSLTGPGGGVTVKIPVNRLSFAGLKVSSRSNYALRALIDLAQHSNGKPVQLHDVAQRTGISAKYLEQILVALKPTGIVRSRAGIHGGYTLGRPPSAIKVGEVIRHLDGPLAPMACASVTAHQTCDNCWDEETCSLRSLWFDVRNAIADILDQTSIADVLSRGRRLEVLQLAYHSG